jgi:GntR family transcriptional regulator
MLRPRRRDEVTRVQQSERTEGPEQASPDAPAAPRSKSARLREALLALIRELPEGAALPTERELCLEFGVSRATVRIVLDRLEAEERIYRRQGKGTFVARAKIEERLGLTSHTEEMRASGFAPGSKLIDVSRLEAGVEIATALRLDPADEVLRIERLRLADGEPIAIEVLFLNAERFDGITAALGDNVSFYQLLRSDYGVELDSAEETIEATLAGARESELLGCALPSALLQLSRLTTDTSGRPIEYVRSLYRGDRFRFRQRLERRPPDPRSGTVLRQASAEDGPGLASVFVSAWRDAYPGVLDEDILASLDEEEVASWLGELAALTPPFTELAEEDGSVVGFVRYGEDPDEPGNGHVYSLYVRPRAGRRGLGRRLLEQALEALAAGGRATVTLWVFEANARARSFYAAAGFVPDGARRVEEAYRAQEIRLVRRPGAAGGGGARGVEGAVETELAPRAAEGLERARDRVVEILDRAIAAGYPAGATLLAVDAEGELLRAHGGWTCLVGERIPTSRETSYDLASLTKVVVTVPLALVLAQRGAWTLDDPAARWLPGFPHGELTLRMLLTHTSGLAPHRPFYRSARGVAAVRRAIYAEPVDGVPAPVAYSDLNYMLLGWAVTRCAGMPLPEAFAELVAEPLGMERSRFRPRRRERRLVAATELDGDQRLEPGLVWGEVHDGNAWALGGIAGHAGLFAPATDLGRFASALLAPAAHPVLSAESIAEMASRQAAAPGDVRALGWRLDAGEWGPWPPSSYWHTGFTGTSILVAPALGLAVVLLLGGVHPVRRPDEQGAIRREIHRAILESLS